MLRDAWNATATAAAVAVAVAAKTTINLLNEIPVVVNHQCKCCSNNRRQMQEKFPVILFPYLFFIFFPYLYLFLFIETNVRCRFLSVGHHCEYHLNLWAEWMPRPISSCVSAGRSPVVSAHCVPKFPPFTLANVLATQPTTSASRAATTECRKLRSRP